MTLRAVLFDVGGTLVQEEEVPGADEVRRERLRAVLPADATWRDELLARALEPLAFEHGTQRQETRVAIRQVLERRGLAATDGLVERVRAACCLRLSSPRAGAVESLRYAKRRGLKVGLVTNVLWRTRADVLADWEGFGAEAVVDSAVTSLDVGWRKPHPAMFERALSELGTAAADAVMVGNLRAADVAPAKRLGMRAVLVRSRETSTSDVQPDAVIAELTELPALFERWL